MTGTSSSSGGEHVPKVDTVRMAFDIATPADSTPIRSPIPRQSDQPFHGFPITPPEAIATVT
jgi:hypothetical protein